MEDPYTEGDSDQHEVNTAPRPSAYETLAAEPELPSGRSEPELSLPVIRKNNVFGRLGMILLFILLFMVGVWLSSAFRQFLPATEPIGAAIAPTVPIVPSSALLPTPIFTPVPTLPYISWRTYEILSSNSRPISGLTATIPGEILLPVCDGGACISQGTYLPGGTRLTFAMRGIGQALPNTKGAILTDTSGSDFVMKEATVASMPAIEFTGDFVGTTAGGYSFTKMRGYQIYLSDSLTLEVSHFSPNGVKVDFAQDDTIFEKIATSVLFSP